MRLPLIKICLLALTLAPMTLLWSQTSVGSSYEFPLTDKVQSFGFDKIDTSNGQLSLKLPLYSLPQKGTLQFSISLRYKSLGDYSTNDCQIVYFGCVLALEDPENWPGVVPIYDQWALTAANPDIAYPEGVYSIYGTAYPYPFVLTKAGSFVSDLGGTHQTIIDSSDSSGFTARSIDGTGYLQTYNTNILSELRTASAIDRNGITHTNPYDGDFINTNTSDPFGNQIIQHQSQSTLGNIQSLTSQYVDSNGNIILDPTIPVSVPTIYGSSRSDMLTDSTLGCPAMPISTHFQTATQSMKWTPPSGAGAGVSTYQFCYALIHVNIVGVFDPLHLSNGVGVVYKLQSVVLPDKTAWLFEYDAADPSDSNSPGNGELTVLTLPTGGHISYTYKNHVAAITSRCVPIRGVLDCSSDATGGRGIASRTTDDNAGHVATWQYDIGTLQAPDRSVSPLALLREVSTTRGPVIQQPDGSFRSNDVVDTYESATVSQDIQGSQNAPIVLTKSETYQGSAGGQNIPIGTRYFDYNYPIWTDVSATTLGLRISVLVASALPKSVSATIPGVGTSISTTVYDSAFSAVSPGIIQDCADPPSCLNLGAPVLIHNNPTQISLNTIIGTSVTDFDGTTVLASTTNTPLWTKTGGVGSPYYKANLVNLEAAITTTGLGNSAEVDYSYDENNGSPQGVFGNVTSIKRPVITGSALATISMIYNSQGRLSKTTSPNGGVTQVNSFQCDGRFPLSTTMASGTSIGETYTQVRDCTTGALSSTTDPNGAITSYFYNDPLNRLTQVQSAVGTSVEAHTTYTYLQNSRKVVQDKDVKNDGLVQTVSTTDGLGRVIREVQASGVILDTQFDLVGHVASVSNPYYSTNDPTYDTVAYTYDALGRQLIAKHASDGSQTVASYLQQGNSLSGLKVVRSDEAGLTSTSYTDALGRLSGIVDNLGNKTVYSYDGLGNLVGVNQPGSLILGESPRIRTFTYDALSRLTCSSNPENSSSPCPTAASAFYLGGTLGYSYDLNGNLLVRGDAKGQLTHYTYDTLNRLLSISYSGGVAHAPVSCYLYDTSATTVPYSLGRLVSEWTQTGSCPAGQTGVPASALTYRNITGYDAAGRITGESQCAFAPCNAATLSSLVYTYDLTGNPTGTNSGIISGASPAAGLLWTTHYDGAGRPDTLTSSISDLTHPGMLFQANAQTLAAVGVAPYGPLGLTAAQYGLPLSDLGGSPALSETRTYDSRTRLIGKVVNGIAGGVTQPTSTSAFSTASALSALQPASINVHVSCNSACGKVDYKEDGAEWAVVALDSGGNYNAPSSALPNQLPGPHTVTVFYLGDAQHQASQSNIVTFTIVGNGPAVASVSISVSSPSFATVEPAFVIGHVSCNSACGYVDFREDGVEWVKAPLNLVGSFYLPTATMPDQSIKSHTVAVSYLGNAQYQASSPSVVSFNIVPVGTAPSNVTTSIDFSQFAAADPSMLVAKVNCASACGQLTAYEDGNLWGPVPLNADGTASSLTSYLPNQSEGQHTVSVSYDGSAMYAASQSVPLSFTILPLGTTQTITHATIDLANFSSSFPATVSVQVDCGVSCGYVDVVEDGADVGSTRLRSDGTYNLALAGQELGQHTLVVYSRGNAKYAPSQSSPITFTVVPPQAVAVTMSATSFAAPDPSTIFVQVNCSITCGAITYVEDGIVCCSFPLNSDGTLAVSTADAHDLSVGQHTLVVRYAGDAKSPPAQSTPIIVTITNIGTTPTTISGNVSPSQFSATQPALVTLHVDCNYACGYVDFIEDGQAWFNAPIDANGNFSVSTVGAPALTQGQHTLDLYYRGSSVYAPSQTTLAFTIQP